ncbi:MAG: YjfB family protein [Planctomycetota bacterium]
MNVANAELGNAIQISVAKKTLDAAKQTGDAMVGLIQDAAQVAKSGRGAVSASPGVTETGGRLDVRG